MQLGAEHTGIYPYENKKLLMHIYKQQKIYAYINNKSEINCVKRIFVKNFKTKYVCL